MKKFMILMICVLTATAVIPTVYLAVSYTEVQMTSAAYAEARADTSPVVSSDKGDKSEQASAPSSAETSPHSSDSTEDADNDRRSVVTLSMQFIDGNTPKEARKAILSIVKQNYFYLKDNNLPSETSVVSKYSDKLYDELCTLYDELTLDLLYNGKRVYIPIAGSSGTNTATSDEYPYMSSVANPWDAFGDDFDRRAKVPCGVSASGLCYLCGIGCDCISALRWYLIDFEITE